MADTEDKRTKRNTRNSVTFRDVTTDMHKRGFEEGAVTRPLCRVVSTDWATARRIPEFLLANTHMLSVRVL